MKKTLSFLLAAVLMLSLTGCGEETEPTESFTVPTAAPTEETTAIDGPVITADVDTVVLRAADDVLRSSYAFIAIDPDAGFVDFMDNPVTDPVTINAAGADALAHWLLSEEALTIAAEFGVEDYGSAVFTLEETKATEEFQIPAATVETEHIRLYAPEEIVSSGLLEELLPVFEETFGYTVELHDADTAWAVNSARRGKADLLLIRVEDPHTSFLEEGFGRSLEGFEAQYPRSLYDGFESQHLPYLHCFDVLCGPASDPACVRDAQTLSSAMEAIAEGGHTFVSLGGDGRICTLESSLWPEHLGIAEDPEGFARENSWYVSAGTDAGPGLVMAEEMGAYILTDYLSFLKFNSYIRQSG